MHRNVPGAFGRLRPHPRLPRVIALGLVFVIVSACGTAPGEAKFSIAVRNAGDLPVRLKVIVASAGTPDRDLLIPARSGILQTAKQVMDIKDGKPDPVVIELYTDTCALIRSVTVGEGRTRIVIEADLSMTTSGGAPDSTGAVEPERVPACAPSE
ncbi:MAG: hypothetical protein EPO36_09105 [Chloroflexota bacterium]|nr:MAG: hypothetical protein EPO36_09105 [Chloroflexota bacterium]